MFTATRLTRAVRTSLCGAAVLALTAAVAPSAASASPTVVSGSSPAAASASPTAASGMSQVADTGADATTARVRYLDITVHKDVVTMPTRLVAGTYYVHVNTPDEVNSIQVVRPPSTLSRARFSALYMNYFNALLKGKYIPAIQTAYNRWRTSATFVGGAQSWGIKVPYREGVFAITLWPGRYWFYASGGSGMPRVDETRWTTHIYQVTVVGTGSRSPVPIVGVVRFGSSYPGPVPKYFIPRTLPRQGFLLALGTRGILSTLRVAGLLPGITDAQLHDGHTCLADDLPPEQRCFNSYWFVLGGAVSAGASAFWYYRLPPGDYVVGQASTQMWAFDSNPFNGGIVTRVTIR